MTVLINAGVCGLYVKRCASDADSSGLQMKRVALNADTVGLQS